MKKQAIILAAGTGSRLRAVSKGTHKALIRIGERRLIDYQLDLLAAVNIEAVCIVAGYDANEVCSVLGVGGECIVNPRYAETNSLYSLNLARDWVTGPFVLMNCDVFAHPDVFHRVLAVNGNAFAYDSSSGHEEEHMKVSLEGNYLKAMSKVLPKKETGGENVGILQFDEESAELLFSEASELIASGKDDRWVAAAVTRIANRVPMRAVDIAGLPWIEIDFPEDLERARREICPDIGCCDRSRMELKVA